MQHADTAIFGRNHGCAQRSTRDVFLRPAASWRNGVSLLGLALAGAALFAAPGRAQTLELNGTTAGRTDFDQSPGVPYTVVQNGVLQLTNLAALTFAGTMQDNSGSGGAFSLQKYGNGTLTMTGSNTYSGETLLGGGTLSAGATNVFSANSVLHSVGGAVDLGGFDQTVGGLTGAGLVGNSSGTAATLTIQTAGGVVGPLFGTRITETAGAISIVKTGAGEQDQNNASNYTGGTTLIGGTLGIGNRNALGTGTLTFTGPAQLAIIGAGLSIANNIVLTSNGTIVRSGDPTILAGVISGAGGLNYAGAGFITVSAANTYTGGTQFGGGVFDVGNDAALGTGTVSINTLTEFDSPASHSLANDFVLGYQLRVSLSNPAAVLQLNGTISGASTVWLLPASTGKLVLNNANRYTGGTYLSNGTLQVGNDQALGTGGILVAGNSTLLAGAAGLTTANDATLQATISVDTNGGGYTLAGRLTDGSNAGMLRKVGAGTLTLSGASSFSGGTRIEQGVVAVSADAALGAGASTLTLAGGDLELTGTAGVTMSRDVVLSGTGGAIDTQALASILTLSGGISGSGALGKQGLGTLNLVGTNSYTGGTTVTAGTLGVNSSTAIGTGGLTLVSATVVQLSDNLSFSNVLTVTDSAIYTQGFNLALTGPIGGSNFTKYGAGTLTLSGNNTLNAGVTAYQGNLVVASSTAARHQLARALWRHVADRRGRRPGFRQRRRSRRRCADHARHPRSHADA